MFTKTHCLYHVVLFTMSDIIKNIKNIVYYVLVNNIFYTNSYIVKNLI